MVGLFACGGDATGPTPLTPATAYWTLQLNYHAATFALSGSQDTLRLAATPLNVLGDPLDNVGTVHFQTADSMVSVDSSGLVKAKYTTSGTTKATVIATLTDTVQHLTLADTCYFQVKATTPSLPLATFTITPPTAKDTVMALNQSFTMRTTAKNANGGTVATLPAFRSSNPNLARINVLTGNISAGRTGQVWLYADTWAYGVPKTDSIQMRIGVPSAATIQVLSVNPTGSTQSIQTFWPQVVTVTAGAKISWTNQSLTDSMDVVFDDPTNVDSTKLGPFPFGTGEGDIAAWVNDPNGLSNIGGMICTWLGGTPPACPDMLNFAYTRQRVFPVSGTYHYHSRIWGSSGTIVVQ